MKIFTEHPHWHQVLEVCTQLSKSGYRAFLAGGCVRDALLGTSPNDFDVATDAQPDQVQKLFPHSLDVGKSFGVIIIPFEEFQVEVATFRQDLEYKDGRRPSGIQYSSPEEDAKRRDFTVNALFYDWVDDKVIDYVNGASDLEKRVIRCVGDAETRFREDHLRLIRAIRFRAQLNFEIEEKTLKAIEELGSLTADVSKERVREELLKLLKSNKRSEGIKLLRSKKIFEAILPNLKSFLDSELFDRSILALEQDFQLTQEVNLWSILFLYLNSPEKPKTKSPAVKSILKELKCSNYVVSHVDKLTTAYWTSLSQEASIATLRKSLAHFGHDLLEIHRIQGAVNPKLSRWTELSQFSMDLPDPWITSTDLKTAGIKEGPKFGEILDKIFDLQLNGELTDKQHAFKYLNILKGD